jgi:hypothetical protein
MTRTRLHDVFLSYSRKDTEMMHRVRNGLIAEGITVWTDEGIEPGTDLWQKAIQDAIENAGAMVVLLSPDAKASQWVGREIHYAQTHRRKIFPLMVRGDDETAVPFALSGAQYIDLRNDFTPFIDKLIPTLTKHLGMSSIREHLPLPFDDQPKPSTPFSAPPQPPPHIAAQPYQPRPMPTPVPAQNPAPAKASEVVQVALSTPKPELRKAEEKPKATPVPIPTDAPLRPLVAWSPLSWLRLLWWVLITPSRYQAYINHYGKARLQPTGSALVSTLTWLPLWTITLGAALGTLPYDAHRGLLLYISNRAVGIPAIVWLSFIIIGWLVTILLDLHIDDLQVWIRRVIGVIVCGIAIVMAVYIPLGVVWSLTSAIIILTIIVTMDVAIVVAFGLANKEILVGIAFAILFGLYVTIAQTSTENVIFVMLIGVSGVIGVIILVINQSLKTGKQTLWNYLIFLALIASYAVLIYFSFFGGYRYLP